MKILRARDLMKRDVAYVSPEMTLAELVRFFDSEHIQGAPVIDGSSRLVGVVSRTDLVRTVSEEEEESGSQPTFFTTVDEDGEEITTATDLGSEEDFPGADRLVAEIMTKTVMTAAEDTTAGELAKMMLDEEIHRIIIAKDHKLTGILSTTDLLAAVVDYEPRGG